MKVIKEPKPHYSRLSADRWDYWVNKKKRWTVEILAYLLVCREPGDAPAAATWPKDFPDRVIRYNNFRRHILDLQGLSPEISDELTHVVDSHSLFSKQEYKSSDLVKWTEKKGYDIPKPLMPLLEEVESSKVAEPEQDQSEAASEQNKIKPMSNTKGDEHGKLFPMKVPLRKDDWFNAIRDCVREFANEKGETPSNTKLWLRMIDTPPNDYGISSDGKRLTMSGVDPLDRETFNKRYKNYFPLIKENK